MEILEKAKILGEAGRYDSCGPKACEVKVESGLGGIYNAKAEHRTCRLFKTLMENGCSFDCKYCSNASGCSKRKARYEPQELASLFHFLVKNLRVEGLFLSSAVAGDPDRVTERMIETVRLLRTRYRFRGYVHFKVLPGTSREMIRQASELSSRMSVNIEAPNAGIMSQLSSCKDYRIDIVRRQRWISGMRLGGGQTTQVILNRLSTDRDMLRMAEWEYGKLNLRRIYYSAFRPVRGTPMENEEAESPLRQNRLYNVDFLLRVYGYRAREFRSIMDGGMLPREDPKLVLAKAEFDGPVDINEAGYGELIRIPGIGPRTARRILGMRVAARGRTVHEGTGKRIIIGSFAQLRRLGGSLERAKPFIAINGKRQTMLSEFR